jgi:hypothetical protein
VKCDVREVKTAPIAAHYDSGWLPPAQPPDGEVFQGHDVGGSCVIQSGQEDAGGRGMLERCAACTRPRYFTSYPLPPNRILSYGDAEPAYAGQHCERAREIVASGAKGSPSGLAVSASGGRLEVDRHKAGLARPRLHPMFSGDGRGEGVATAEGGPLGPPFTEYHGHDHTR